MERGNSILRKVAFAGLTLCAVMVFNFVLFRILPGDPVKLIIHSPRMTREAQDRMRANFGLDKPVWLDVDRLKAGDLWGAFDSQFTAYVRNLIRGDLASLSPAGRTCQRYSESGSGAPSSWCWVVTSSPSSWAWLWA